MEIRLPPSQEETIEHLEQAKFRWFRRQLAGWAKHHLRDFPWRRTKDPYVIFVAEFLKNPYINVAESRVEASSVARRILTTNLEAS